MPQGRILLKSICQSKKLPQLKTDGARLLYTWLIPNVDVNGCFSGDPQVIKGQIFTRLKHSIKVIETYLQDLENIGLIVRYEIEGDMYLIIPDFEEKQPSLKPEKEGKPTIPLPTPDQLQSKSGVTPPISKGKESKEKEIYLDHVCLSKHEYEKVKEWYGEQVRDKYIEDLNGWILQIGKKKADAKYKSHYATILNWIRRDGIQKIKKTKQPREPKPLKKRDTRTQKLIDETVEKLKKKKEAMK